MTLDRELSGGSLNELGFVGREASDGSIIESGKVWREEADGTLTLIYTGAFTGILRPNVDVTNSGGVEDTTGGDGDGDLYDEVDEASPDGDSTFVYATVAAPSGGSVQESFRVGVEDPDPTPTGDETITLRVVARVEEDADPSFVSDSINLQLREGGASIFKQATLDMNGDTAYTTYELVSQPADHSGVTNWDGLQARVGVRVSEQNDIADVTHHFRITQVEVEFTL